MKPQLITAASALLACLLLLAFGGCATSSTTLPAPHSQWQAVSYADKPIGHRQIIIRRKDNIIITEQWLRLQLQQPGVPARQSETLMAYTESLGGEPIAIRKVLNTPSAKQEMTARISRDQLYVRLHPSQENPEVLPLPDNFLLPEGVRQAMLRQQGKRRQLRYSNWSFVANAFEEFLLTAKPYSGGAPPQPESPDQDYSWELRRTKLGNGQREPVVIYADAAFHPLAEYSQSAGEQFAIQTCSRDCALADFVAETHVYRQVIRSPYRISDSALAGKIRYQLRGPVRLQPPQTQEQSVEQRGDGWEIVVCAACGPEPAPTEAQLQQALGSNHWLPANDPLFRRIAAEHRDGDTEPSAVMARLTRLVQHHMSEVADYAGYATASQAWHSQNGDCTEHALLLATLGRAAGIPTRVVLGLAYNNERFLGRRFVFVPHMWVQAWTGARWQSFDSALGEFHAGYIALALSEGEPNSLLSLNEDLHQLEIVSAEQLRRR